MDKKARRLGILVCAFWVTQPSLVFAQSSVQFEDIEASVSHLDAEYLRRGVDIPLHQLLKVQPGIGPRDVTSSLGEPAKVDTLSSGRAWEYNLRLPIATDEVLVCQYKVLFNAVNQVASTQWRRNVCQLAFSTWIERQAPAKVETLTYSADVLFGFKRHELSPDGRRALSSAAEYLKESYLNPVINLVGYTDRIGPEGYNLELSVSRAQSVRDYLEQSGLAGAAFHVKGNGEQDPLVACEGSNEADDALIQCLQPNRRVEIEVFEKS